MDKYKKYKNFKYKYIKGGWQLIFPQGNKFVITDLDKTEEDVLKNRIDSYVD